MSRPLDRALRKATSRDRKRTPRMSVSGKSVFNLSRLLRGAAGGGAGKRKRRR
jgi:hypothetical protein